MDPASIYEFIQTGGLLAGSAIFIWSLYTGKLKWKSDYEDMKAAKDKDISRLEQALNQSQVENRAHIERAMAKLEILERRASGDQGQ